MQYLTKTPLALMLAVASTIVSANDEPKTLDESEMEWVSVRGAYFGQQVSDSVKTPTLLLDVPQSVSIIDAQQISELGLFSVADIMQYTPSVSVGQGEDHRDQLTIRGQNTTADFFVDGLRDDVQYFRPLYNIERVEVLRGANALLFGRGGGGGVVNRVTKSADTADSFNSVAANANSFGAASISIDSNAAVNEQHAFRLNAVVDSIENHRDFKDGDRFAINPTYTWVAGLETKLNLSYEYVDDDRVVDRGVPSLDGKPLEGFEETYFGDPGFNNTTLEAHIARAQLEHRFSDQWAVNGTIQYADYDKFYQNLYPVGFDDVNEQVTLDGYRDVTTRDNTLLQVNIVGEIETGDIEHTVLAGVEYGQQNTENARLDALFADSQDDQQTFLFSDPLVIPAYTLTSPVRDRESEVSFTSVFFQDEIALTEQWILVAGLRYDRFEIDVLNNDGGAGLAIDSSDTEVSPRAGIIYKPSQEVSVYASYSKSFLPRSGDQFLTLSLTSAALDAEEFKNQEVGIKWNITETLSLNAAYFEVERDSGTTVDPLNPERSILVGTETEGFELQLVGQINEAWVINAGYSNLDGQQVGNVSGGVIDNSDLAQVPEHMVSLWNRVRINERWRLGAGLIHQSEQYATLSNNVELPDFTRIDAAIYYQPTPDLQLQLNVQNLTDEEYFPAAHNDNNITTGAPVNATLGMTYSF